MHAANSYLLNIGKLADNITLSASEAGLLRESLQTDARNFFQCGVVSFVDAARSIEKGFYSWATVKLYYVVFYGLRARLALAGDCIYHVTTKPRVISAQAGAASSKLSGNTHKAVLQRFRNCFPTDFFLSQDIDNQNPLDWFLKKREDTNYRLPRFVEPGVPDYLMFASNTSIRMMLSAYLADDVYIFDVEHAVVAFPFRLLSHIRGTLSVQGLTPLLPSEVDFLRVSLRDRAGNLTSAERALC